MQSHQLKIASLPILDVPISLKEKWGSTENPGCFCEHLTRFSRKTVEDFCKTGRKTGLLIYGEVNGWLRFHVTPKA